MVTKDLSKEHVWRRWLQALDILGVKYNIYVHCSDPSVIKSEWLKKYIIPVSLPTAWDFHMDAELTLLEYALDKTNDAWFINLSETTVPYVSPQKFQKMFKEFSTNTILSYRKPWWNVKEENRANLQLFPAKARFGNSEWCVICNEDMRTIVYVWKKTEIINTMMKEPHADESIFSVTLYLANNFKNTINALVTIMDWERDYWGPSPHTFTEYSAADKKFITEFVKGQHHLMFIRKIASSFPDEVLYHWEKLD
jgi:hypothetical protein